MQGRDTHQVDLAQTGETAPAEETALGDVNADGMVNASDAALILIASAQQGAGGERILTDAQEIIADVNADGSVNAVDVSLVLIHAAEAGAGESDGAFSDDMPA